MKKALFTVLVLIVPTLTVFTCGHDSVSPSEEESPVDTNSVQAGEQYSMHDYWPLAVGNAWIWEDPATGYWWLMSVDESLSIAGCEVWKVSFETDDGTKWNRWLTFTDSMLAILDSSALDELPEVSWESCRQWNGPCAFGLFDEYPDTGATYDPRWQLEAQWVRGSLSELLARYPVWESGAAAVDSFPVDSVDHCVGLYQPGSDDDSLYSILGLHTGPIVWDGWSLVWAKLNGEEHGSIPESPYRYGFSVNADTASDLLYWITDDWGLETYFLGYRDSAFFVPNLVVFDGNDGEPESAVFIRADFTPVLWVMDGLTIGVVNKEPLDTATSDTVFDASTAYHVSLADTRIDFVADIEPAENMATTMQVLRDLFLVDLSEHIALFDSVGIETWEDLKACAWIEGPQQPLWQAQAIWVSLGHALATYENHDSLQYHLPKQTAFRNSVANLRTTVLKSTLLGVGKWAWAEYTCKHCPKPGVPTVSMLQCNGIKAIIGVSHICHNSYFWNNGLAGECIDKCKTSMKCFTNICMPRQVAASEAEELLFENNLHITAKDVAKALADHAMAFRSIIK